MLSLPTPPKCFAASVHATFHAAFARKRGARPSGLSTFEAIWVHLRYGPATRSPSLKMASSIGFRMESFLPTLLFKLRGLDSYPGGTFTHCSCQPSLDAHFSFPIHSQRCRSQVINGRKGISRYLLPLSPWPTSGWPTNREAPLSISRALHGQSEAIVSR